MSDIQQKRKADANTLRLRIEAVYKLLLDGWADTAIVEQAEKQWQIGRSQAYTYVKKARERMEEDLFAYRQAAIAEHVALRRRLRKDALAEGDRRFALEVLKDEAKLLGLYAPEGFQLTGAGGGPVEIALAAVVDARKRAVEFEQKLLAEPVPVNPPTE